MYTINYKENRTITECTSNVRDIIRRSNMTYKDILFRCSIHQESLRPSRKQKKKLFQHDSSAAAETDRCRSSCRSEARTSFCVEMHWMLSEPMLYETSCLYARSCSSQQEGKALSFCCVGRLRTLAVVEARKSCRYGRHKRTFDLAHYIETVHVSFLIRCFVPCASENFPAALFPQIYTSELSFCGEAVDKGALSYDAKREKKKQCPITCEVYLLGD